MSTAQQVLQNIIDKSIMQNLPIETFVCPTIRIIELAFIKFSMLLLPE